MPDEEHEQLCEVCDNPALPGSEFCLVHTVVRPLVAPLQKAVDSMFKAGEKALEDAVQRGVASGLEGGAGLGDLFRGVPPGPPPGARPRSPRPPRRRGRDPFRFLGIDRAQATPEIVRKVQRRLAAVYHPDTCGAAISGAKIQEINAAAEACLTFLRERAGKG